MSRPLVTFALFSYNQERFIREAVRGALAQTYSPLEVILSDDCSRDKTFEIMQEEVAGYEGPHQIRLNRNDYTLGVGEHVNRVMEFARGKLIVGAAGDDVSLPSRTEELEKVWSNGGVFSIWSNVITMDEDGVVGGAAAYVAPVPAESWQETIQSGRGGLGASQAWDRIVFDTFGPLPAGVVHEDLLITFRSALLGKVGYIDKALVKYRRHSASTMNDKNDELDLWSFVKYHTTQDRWWAVEYEGMLNDIRLFLPTHPEMKTELFQAAEVIEARAKFYKFRGYAVESSNINRLRACYHTIKPTKKLGARSVMKVCIIGASPMTYYRMQKVYYKAKNWCRILTRCVRSLKRASLISRP